MKRNAILLCILLASGCASLPEELRHVNEQALLPFATTLDNSALMQQARWGGEIAIVRNRQSGSELEVVQFALGRSGRPVKSDQSGGRFRVSVDRFLDPAIYAPGRQITALGQFEGTVADVVGEQPYRFPLLKAQHIHLWPEIKPAPAHYAPDPFFYSPLMMRPLIVVPRER